MAIQSAVGCSAYNLICVVRLLTVRGKITVKQDLYLIFFRYSLVLILKRKCLFGAGRLNPLWEGWYSFNHNICTRCSSRHYGIGCHVPMFVSVLHPYQNIVAKDQKLFHTTLGTEFHHENFDHISPEFVRAFKKIWMELTGLSQNSVFFK